MIAREMGVPLVRPKAATAMHRRSTHVRTAKKAASRLLKAAKKLPSAQLQRTWRTVRQHVGAIREVLSPDTLEQVAPLLPPTGKADESDAPAHDALPTDSLHVVADLPQPNVAAADREWHGRQVVSRLVTAGELGSFIRRWRAYFLSTMSPR